MLNRFTTVGFYVLSTVRAAQCVDDLQCRYIFNSLAPDRFGVETGTAGFQYRPAEAV